MDSLNTYKDHVLFKQNQQILETKLQNFTDVESIPESDSTILASYCVHKSLYIHSKMYLPQEKSLTLLLNTVSSFMSRKI